MVGSLAAVGRVVLEPEDADLGQLREQLVGREDAVGLPLVDVGVDLVLDDVADGLRNSSCSGVNSISAAPLEGGGGS